MLLIYTHKITNRNKYAFNLIFRNILGVKFSLTANVEEFKNYAGPKINYSLSPIGNELFFYARNILFETGITEQNITVSEWNGSKVFFTAIKTSALPFDPFAASFYLVSRYEECLPHIRDEYDRFEPKHSLAFQNNFLKIPVVNIWAEWIKKIILDKFSSLSIPKKKYEFLSTIDIDNAYAFREKGFMRSLGGYAKSLLEFDFADLSLRTNVLIGRKKDPYDTYDYQFEIHEKYKIRPIYFFLLGDYGVNDKNLPVSSNKFRKLIKHISDYADVGIHPSFGSNENNEQLKTEILRLSKILHRDVTKSRQHFLKLTLPQTYRNLIELDITDDYTMGYASELGFRASICSTFHFYDLDNEQETKLRVHPFAAMEATLKYYLKANPENAIDYLKPLIAQVKAVNGTFISLWHNESLGDDKTWAGWKPLYEEMIKEAL